MSNERIATLVAMLEIPEGQKHPHFCYNSEDNVFSAIGAASRAWKQVNRDVAERIMTVINGNCQSHDECLAFLDAIGGEPIDC